MKYIDFLFYSYYCHFERRNKRFPKIFWGDSRLYAIVVMYLSIAIPFGAIYALIDIFVTPLPEPSKANSGHGRLFGILLGIPTIGPLAYRYYHNKKIIRRNYKMFKDRWGEDPRENKKGRIVVLIYTFCTIILPWFGPVFLYFIFK